MIGPEILALAIPIVALIAWAIIRVSGHFFEYLGRSNEPTAEGASLTTRELHGLIAEAVSDATAELEARVEALELQLNAPSRRPMLDEPDDPQFLAADQGKRGSRNETH